MEINYIILAHKNPDQLKRLVNRLKEPGVNFFIHIDKNVDIAPFLSHFEPKDKVYFLEDQQREPGVWGDIGIVRGTLNAMRKIINDKKKGYCILLTGQDYPLQTNQKIKQFLDSNWPSIFISFYQSPCNWQKPFKPRIKHYKINRSLNRGHFLLLSTIYDKDFYTFETLGKLNFLRKTGRLSEWKKIFKEREFPNNMKPYGGGVYWALPVDTVKQILDYVNSHPDYLEFHKYTLCADEVFFHSLIMHLKSLCNYELKPTLTYVNWLRESGPLPVTFERDDFDELKEASGDYLFARKFDVNLDEKILDQCDKILLNFE